jgi:hypothetical protein
MRGGAALAGDGVVFMEVRAVRQTGHGIMVDDVVRPRQPILSTTHPSLPA